MTSIEKFLINPTNEFHVLRHFEFVDDSYKKTLLNKEYWYYDYEQKKFIFSFISQEDIEFAIETIGTKFFKNIAPFSNPRELLELIKKKFIDLNIKNEVKWISENERKITNFTIENNSPVGEMNCFSIDKIQSNNKSNLKSVFRSKCAGENKVTVNTIKGINLLTTNIIYVEIVEIEQLPFYIITAFPDCAANNNSPDDEIVFVV